MATLVQNMLIVTNHLSSLWGVWVYAGLISLIYICRSLDLSSLKNFHEQLPPYEPAISLFYTTDENEKCCDNNEMQSNFYNFFSNMTKAYFFERAVYSQRPKQKLFLKNRFAPSQVGGLAFLYNRKSSTKTLKATPVMVHLERSF